MAKKTTPQTPPVPPAAHVPVAEVKPEVKAPALATSKRVLLGATGLVGRKTGCKGCEA